MAEKYTVQNVGRPYGPCETIPESAWGDLSKHTSEDAAWKAIGKYKAHLSPGSWDDHYRVIAPDGSQCSRLHWLDKQNEREYRRMMNRN